MAASDAAPIEMKRPDDFHIHLRDGPGMSSVLGRERARGAGLSPAPPPPHDSSRPPPPASQTCPAASCTACS